MDLLGSSVHTIVSPGGGAGGRRVGEETGEEGQEGGRGEGEEKGEERGEGRGERRGRGEGNTISVKFFVKNKEYSLELCEKTMNRLSLPPSQHTH